MERGADGPLELVMEATWQGLVAVLHHDLTIVARWEAGGEGLAREDFERALDRLAGFCAAHVLRLSSLLAGEGQAVAFGLTPAVEERLARLELVVEQLRCQRAESQLDGTGEAEG